MDHEEDHVPSCRLHTMHLKYCSFRSDIQPTLAVCMFNYTSKSKSSIDMLRVVYQFPAGRYSVGGSVGDDVWRL